MRFASTKEEVLRAILGGEIAIPSARVIGSTIALMEALHQQPLPASDYIVVLPNIREIVWWKNLWRGMFKDAPPRLWAFDHLINCQGLCGVDRTRPVFVDGWDRLTENLQRRDEIFAFHKVAGVA